ncbi:hypothetical protein [Iningainema tapete]|uniref:hypothetical protein n=1 Tax=Iningainema tapete TaxID=2806730 RepID=UPI001EE22BED|nr:hypothetical protein [Iningainema tapete]
MAKVTVTLYMEEEDKEALQKLADAEERSLSQMAVLILKRTIKQALEEGKIRLLKPKGRNEATGKQPSVSDLPSAYRTNISTSQPNSNVRVTAAYLQTHEFQKLAQKIAAVKNAAGNMDLKFKVQIELGGESQPSDEAIAQLNEILQQITENLKLQ